MRVIGVYGILAAVILAGCSSDPRLHNIDTGNGGPDEFAILPTKPLQMPDDLNRLPAPTPGGANRTDPTPKQDAVASLGGSPAQMTARGVGAGDGALLSYTARVGTDPAIRTTLAAEDEAFRAHRGRRFLEILARSNVYYRAYQPLTLEPWAEFERWRRAGARVPSAPPAPVR